MEAWPAQSVEEASLDPWGPGSKLHVGYTGYLNKTFLKKVIRDLRYVKHCERLK